MGRALDRALWYSWRIGAVTVSASFALGLIGIAPAVAQTSPTGEISYGCPSSQSTCAVGSDGSNPHLMAGYSNAVGTGTLSLDGARQSFVAEPGRTSSNNAPYVLYVAGADGTGANTIWTLPGTPDDSPVWNPAGTELALLVQADASANYENQLWVVGSDGSAPHLVVANAGFILGTEEPTWSPDGKTIAYEGVTTAADGSTRYNLSTVPVAGGTSTVLDTLGADALTTLSWSPDGATILAVQIIPDIQYSYNSLATQSAVVTYASKGGAVTAIIPAATLDDQPLAAYYSPDGSQIVVGKARGLFVGASDGSGLHVIVDNPDQSFGHVTGWARRPIQTALSPVGYDLVASDGGVFSYNTEFHGSLGGRHLNAPIVSGTATPDGGGYWLVAGDGGVFTFGDAPFYGSAVGAAGAPVVGLNANGNQYSLVGSDATIYNFQNGTGSYGSYNSISPGRLAAPIVGFAGAGGFWLTAADGGVFTNVDFQGSLGGVKLNKPIVGMASDPATGGYWLVAADGGVFSFNAPFYGSMGGMKLNKPIVGMAADPATGGYWLVASDGGVFSFNAPFLGSAGNIKLNKPIVAMTVETPSGLGS